MKPVTDPSLLAQLNGAAPAGLKPVADPAVLGELENQSARDDAIISAIEQDMGRPLTAEQRAQIRAGGDFDIAATPPAPVAAPVPAAQPTAKTNNPFSGALARLADVAGSALGGIANVSERVGDTLSLQLPEWARGTGDLSDDVIRNQNQLQSLFDARDWLRGQAKDVGYQPTTTFEQVKEDPISLRTPTFIGEQAITSIPDMAASIFTLPAYVLGRTQEIGERRVQLDDRTGDPTLGDLFAAAPGAVVESMLERFATGRLVPGAGSVGGNVASRVGKEVAVQAGTEAVEEGAANLAESVGTQRGVDRGELLDAMGAGALVGGGIGAGVQGAREVVGAARTALRPVTDPALVAELEDGATPTQQDAARSNEIDPALLQQGNQALAQQPAQKAEPAGAEPAPAGVMQPGTDENRNAAATMPAAAPAVAGAPAQAVAAQSTVPAEGQAEPQPTGGDLAQVFAPPETARAVAQPAPAPVVMPSQQTDPQSPASLTPPPSAPAAVSSPVAAPQTGQAGAQPRAATAATAQQPVGTDPAVAPAPRNRVAKPDETVDFTPADATRRAKFGDTTITYWPQQGEVNVGLVATPPKARGQGSARTAMQQFLARTDAAGLPVTLTVAEQGASVEPARLRGFYESLGFRQVGEAADGSPKMRREAGAQPAPAAPAPAAAPTAAPAPAAQQGQTQLAPPVAAGEAVEGAYRHATLPQATVAVRRTDGGYEIEWGPDDIEPFRGARAAQQVRTALEREGYTARVADGDVSPSADIREKSPSDDNANLAERADAMQDAPLEDTADDRRPAATGRPARSAEDSPRAAEDEAARLEGPEQNQRGRGTSPETMRVSFTNRRSWFEQAFTDAGVNPEQATLWPIQRQFDTLSKLVKDKFGITVKKTEQIQGRFAVDQMLDLYRNMQFMAHTLGMPSEGMGLGGTLNLLLRKGVQYFGAFYPVAAKVEGVEIPSGSIVLPKRSNSFAHEWMHALDHHLVKKLDAEGGFKMLSQKVKREGIDADPNSSSEAFVALLDNLFYDQAALAAKMLALQNAADSESPSARAKAKAQMESILRGNARPQVASTDYRNSAANFEPGRADYWANPQEMLARAFEAYTAYKVEAAGGSTEAIAKGDFAYLSDADERLAKTFPKGEERNRIFASFDRLFEQMSKEQLVAQGVAAAVPANMQIFDPRVWDKTPERQKEYAGLFGAIRQTVDEIRADHQAMQRQKERPQNPKPVWQRVQDVLRFPMYAQRSVFRVLERRYPNSAALRTLADQLVTAPGKDRVVQRVFEEAVEQRVKQSFNRLGNIVARHQLEKLDSAGLRTLRDLLISEDAANAPANLRAAAPELRKLLDTEWYRNQQAGLDIGYARNGYLPRMLDMPRVMTDGNGFTGKAAKVYEIIFDTEIGSDPAEIISREGALSEFVNEAKMAGLTNEAGAIAKIVRQINRLQNRLKDADEPDKIRGQIDELNEKLEEQVGEIYGQVRGAYGKRRANNWLGELKKNEANDFDAMSPDSNYTKKRSLPPEADKILEDYYINDPLEAIQIYLFQSARRTEYATRFGAKSEKLKDLFDQMAAEGVSVEDQAYVTDMVKSLTGRSKSNLPQAFSGFLNFMHAIGTMSLLPRAVISSLGEPTAAAIRSGNLADTMKPYLNLAKQVAGTADSKQWAEIARAIGAVSNGFADTLAANRFGGTFDSTIKSDKLMSRFFKRTFLTGLTNAQRTSILPISHQYLMGLASRIRDGKDVSNSRALLAELGVADAKQFSDWLLQSESIPDVNELYDSNGVETPHGSEYMTAVNRFLDQTIQNPKGYDRPLFANNPIGRLMYGILSFSMSFWQNVWKRQGALIAGIAERKGVTAAAGYTALQLAPSMLSLFLVQTVVSTLREALFNPERWEEWEKKGVLAENMLQLGFTRSFSFGLVDPVIQAFNGLKYQRDLANLPLGAVPGFVLQSLQMALQPFVRNSEKTNNAEFKAAQGAYQLTAMPLTVYALSMAPGGRLVDPLYGLAMMYLTSPGVRDRAATAIVGEKDSRREKREKDARTTGRGGGKERPTGR